MSDSDLADLLAAVSSLPIDGREHQGSGEVSYGEAGDTLAMVEKAYHFAKEKHQHQRRESGEPYFGHLLATAHLACDLRLDREAVAAALLHDTIEDCGVTHAELAQEFSPSVADMVEGVSKLTEFEHATRSYRQAGNLRKMMVAAGRDMRGIFIKLCDRLHNMRTLEFMSPTQQRRKALETADFYAPIAHRLGLLSVRLELEDLCFRYLEPEHHYVIHKAIEESAPARQEFIRRNERAIRELLREAGINAYVNPIERNAHYVWRKMLERGVPFNEIDDVVNILIIVPSEADCYHTLGAIHSKMRPVPYCFNDYIARPKSNMYQSLHTTVVSGPGEKVALRIRTQEMHNVAERGIIAHWYAQKADARGEFNLRWMHTFLEDQKQIQNPEEFLDSIRTELFPFEIVVLTPKGDTVVLPHMATPLDFAYAVSSKLGHHTQAALVNGREVPLNYRLRSGDTVMLITNPEGAPVKEWLDYVQLATTKLVIQRYLDHEEFKRKYTLGREKTARLLDQHGFSIEELEDSAVMGAVALNRGLDSISALYCSIAEGNTDLVEILSGIRDQVSASAPGGLCSSGENPGGSVRSPGSQNSAYITPYLLVQNEPGGSSFKGKFGDFAIEGACCCGPLIGEPIIGIFSPSGSIMVHSADCKTVKHASPESLKKVIWNPNFSGFKTVHVTIHTEDRIGMLKAVVETISMQEISINQAYISTSKYGEGHFELDLIISTYDQYQKMSESLRKTPGILQVSRIYKDK